MSEKFMDVMRPYVFILASIVMMFFALSYQRNVGTKCVIFTVAVCLAALGVSHMYEGKVVWNNEKMPIAIAAGRATEEAIRLHAYLLWERAGRPDGEHLRFWLQAEKELKGG